MQTVTLWLYPTNVAKDAVEPNKSKPLSREFDDVQPGISEDEIEVGIRRKRQIVLGIVIVLGGIVLLPAPGPGWAIIVVGLNMIKPDNRLVRVIRRVVPGIPEDGEVPKKVIVIGLVIMAIATAYSVTAFFTDLPTAVDMFKWAWNLIF